MSRIRGLELQFNLEKKNLKSKNDCVIVAVHCLLINENLQCVGTGDEWPEADSFTTELLPEKWNSDQDVYSIRYSSKDKISRILLKATAMEHILQIDAVMNKDIVASLPVPVKDYISDNYGEYSTAYLDLDSLIESFHKEIIQNLKPKASSSKKSFSPPRSTSEPPRSARPSRTPFDFEDPRDPYLPGFPRNDGNDLTDPFQRPRYPRIGGSDLDPFGRPGGGGMFADPSSFGVPTRPTLPQFGVGGPGGLPRGAVPPGARFDPFMPPIRSDRRRNPDPDHFAPPDFDDFM